MNQRHALIVGVLVAAVAFPLGMAFQHERTVVEPWDDGLLHVSCPRTGNQPFYEATVRGIGVMDDSDDHAANPPVATIDFPYDPKAQKSPKDLQFKMDRHRFPLGCFAQGIRQKDIVRRSWR
jgi:hypothetical protein